MKNTINRKYPAINPLEIYTHLNYKGWNAWLYQCFRTRDVEKLKRTCYGIQAGMSDLAKAKLNTPEIVVLFLRLQKSLHDTARKIYRELYPNPLDNGAKGIPRRADFIEAKRNRDKAFRAWVKESSF